MTSPEHGAAPVAADDEGERTTNPTQEHENHSQSTAAVPDRRPYEDAADGIRDSGLGDPLPLPYGKKTPPPAGYTGASGVRPSGADLEEWKANQGGDNVAIRLAPGVVGVDRDDHKNEHAAATIAALEAAGGPLPETVRVTARVGECEVSGSYLYRLREGADQSLLDDPGPGVELIRHGYRYQVGPPSRHPEGMTYMYVYPDGTRTTTPPRADQLPALSEGHVEHLTAKTASSTVEAAQSISTEDLEATLEELPSLRVSLVSWVPTPEDFAGDCRAVRRAGAGVTIALGPVAGTWETGGNGSGMVPYLAARAIRGDATRRVLGLEPGLVDTFLEVFADAGHTWTSKVKSSSDYAAERGPLVPEDWTERVKAARLSRNTRASTKDAGPVDPFVAPEKNVAPIERLEGRSWKDSHVASAFAEHHADDLCHVDGLGFLAWREHEGRWGHASSHEVLHISNRFAQELAIGAALTGDSANVKSASTRLTKGAIVNTVDLVKGDPLIAASVDDLDAHPLLLNTPAGVVDLRTGELHPSNRDQMHTKSTADPYRPGATHPDFDAALEALPSQAERDYLQEWLGATLIGMQSRQDTMLLLKGGGANGKSAIVGALVAALGDYAVTLTAHVLMSGMEGAHTTEMTDLRGARLALAEELPDASTLSEKRVKDLVGTPTMKGRRMRENNIEWKATHSLVATTNTWPKITGTDHGVWRRLDVLVFPYRFVPTPDEIRGANDRLGDLGLKPRMLGTDREHGPYPQREAVLAWAVEGAVRYLSRGDQPTPVPASVKAALKEWRDRSDSLGAFLSQRVEAAPGWMIPTLDLLKAYNAYLEERGHNPLSDQKFTTRLDGHPALPEGASKGRPLVAEGPHPSRPQVSHPPVAPGARGAVHRSYEDGQKVTGYVGLRWVSEAPGD